MLSCSFLFVHDIDFQHFVVTYLPVVIAVTVVITLVAVLALTF